ncbi:MULTISPECIES: TRAP transporter small permease [Chelatococcus]|uniref:TRAP transporter small permease protein n=1 Tax=Chelatococcus caeni TaxID=1348468 RepID=A0A840C403_9HYPH|nr:MULTISPECIES: TRAP transporter small permease subunit [Chelatococcus]MBB4019573.1 TRAP-type C4-dicarboxylate transport system permease small subunit [Chelatococcus caeni]
MQETSTRDARAMAPALAPGRIVACAPALGRLSRALARIEAAVAGLAVFVVFSLLMANVVSRSFGRPLIWTDELAVNCMVWAAFIGASVGLAHRQHIAVMLLPDMLPGRVGRAMAIAVDLSLLLFLGVLAVVLWRWFDPVGLLKAETLEAFSADTFNFIYQEPTVTLGVSKFWFWLVLPVFCLTAMLHVVAGLAAHVAERGEAHP